MKKYIKALLFSALLLIGGCNSIDMNDPDLTAMKKLFEDKGFKVIKIEGSDSKFYRHDGKLIAKVVLHFEYKPLYDEVKK